MPETHEDNHHSDQHASHDHHEAAKLEEAVLLKLQEKLRPFLPGHHHHHHHDHHAHEEHKPAYKAPAQLTNGLALFAIKKLSLMSHLPAADVRALSPVPPGVLSWSVYVGLGALNSFYAFYIWRNLGYKGFWGKPGLLGLGIVGASFGAKYLVDNAREGFGAYRRNNLVKKYREKYGDQYLIDVLDPSFRLAAHH